jgi:hypothetical protein
MPEAPPVVWRPVAESTAQPPPGSVVFQPIDGSAATGPGPVWRPVEVDTANGPPPVRWFPVQPETVAAEPAAAPKTEADPWALAPRPSDYAALLRLGQLPTANGLEDGYGQLSFQQVSPGTGGVGGGSGNQNYGFRADAAVNTKLLISGFYTYADDPLFARISVRPTQPENLWTVAGGAVRASFAGGVNWGLAGEGSIEVFTVGSGGCFSNACSSSSDNIFNTSGQRVLTRNWVGSLSLPLSWNPMPRWQLSLVPGVSFLPPTQAGNSFYGTNATIGVGSSYRIGDQLNLFGSAIVPLGPGSNAFNSSLTYLRVPIVSVGANVAVNPRIGLEASVTNGFGLSPATAVLALPSAPYEPMLSGRFVWNPGAPDSLPVRFTPRQRSLTLGGLGVATALLPPAQTTQLWANGDSLGNLLVSGAYSVSNDFSFEASGGTYGNAGASATGATGNAASFLNTYVGPGNRNIRFGGKAMVFRPTKGLPVWAAGRITVGRNFQTSSYQGYLFFETVNTWEATPWLALNLNPKLAWSGFGTPWGVGLSANIQLGRSFQLIPEVNAVATSFGGPNGTNGTLALRWLPTPTTALDVYASNASGLLDLGQLLGTDQIRFGGKLTVQF